MLRDTTTRFLENNGSIQWSTPTLMILSRSMMRRARAAMTVAGPAGVVWTADDPNGDRGRSSSSRHEVPVSAAGPPRFRRTSSLNASSGSLAGRRSTGTSHSVRSQLPSQRENSLMASISNGRSAMASELLNSRPRPPVPNSVSEGPSQTEHSVGRPRCR
jgi:hypothetical protein